MRIFLSYVAADQAWARQLASQMSKAGLQVVDRYTSTLPGENPYLAVGKALQESDGIVFLFSPDLLASDQLAGELEYALGDSRFEGRMVGVLLRGAKADEAPWIMRHLRFLEDGGSPTEVARRLEGRLLKSREAGGSKAHATS